MEGSEHRVPLDSINLSVGRHSENDIVLLDPLVSRKHCLIERTGEEFVLTDLGSRYGSYVNDEQVTGTRRLVFGDRLRIGNTPMVIVEKDETRAPVRVRTVTSGGGRPPSPAIAALHRARDLADRLDSAFDDPTVFTGSPQEVLGALSQSLDEAERAFVTMERDRHLSDTLGEVGKVLSLVSDPDVVLRLTLDMAVGALEADRGYVLLKEDGQLTARHGRNMGDLRGISTSIAERVLADGTPLLTTDAQSDARFMEAHSVMINDIRAVMCVPLQGPERAPIGSIYVDARRISHFFNERGLEFLVSFAGQAALAIEAARLTAQNAAEGRRRERLSRYLSEPVIAEILAGQTQEPAAGKSRTMTLLFTDIRGFTSLLELLSPEQAVEMLNDYFTEMVEEIHAELGTLDKYTGDGLMAFWGAPKAQEDHALRAVRAALRMQKRMPGLIERWRREKRSFAERAGELAMGIGVHSGDAVVGTIGSPKRYEYTAIGDAVNLSARIQGLAAGGEILVSKATLDLLGDRALFEALPPAKLKGKSADVALFRVTGMRE